YDFPSTINHNSITVKDIKKYNQQRPFGPKKRICYAPFNNLHFQINGEITSCSFNYDFVLGNIHTSTIKEIWNGEKAADFRSTLACFNLEKCASCKSVLLSKNYSSFPPLKYDMYANDEKLYPTQMSFEMSNLCNFECIMCNENFSSLIRKNKFHLPPIKFAYPEHFFDELNEFIPHLKIATFIGGEPLLIKSYFRIWEAILKLNHNCVIHLQTNCSVLPNRFLEMIESKQFEIGISLDGFTKETFEKIRLNADFNQIQKNVAVLIDKMQKGKVNLNINFCPLTLNWHELPQMIEYANEKNISFKIVNVENPRHLSLHHRSETYIQNIIESIGDYNFEKKINFVTSKNIATYNDFVKQLSYFKSEATKREFFFEKQLQIENSACDLLSKLFLESPLFANFSKEQKESIKNDLIDFIIHKSENKMLQNRVFLRLYYMLYRLKETTDGESSRNPTKGLEILKNAASEFYVLEMEENF
ncbi:MAG: SPASM domain-containing protein, partial [Chitinophagaceae bacterium]|nr:SPASM domain-containing protein [Chitinophagaceae bacterium]